MKEVPAVRPHPSDIIQTSIESQRSTVGSISRYIGRSLDNEFPGPDVVLEGVIRVEASVRDRKTGEVLGKADIVVFLQFAEEHQPPTDQDTLEVSPGESHPDGIVD